MRAAHCRHPCYFLLLPINATRRLNFFWPAHVRRTQHLHEQFIRANGADYPELSMRIFGKYA